VIAIIATDGMENSSREYNRWQIQEIIKRQQEVYSWQILFIGANVDAVQVAASYGIPAPQALTFRTSTAGVRNSYNALNEAMMRGRQRGQYGFTAEEAAAALEEG
jgi:hypothetical protein